MSKRLILNLSSSSLKDCHSPTASSMVTSIGFFEYNFKDFAEFITFLIVATFEICGDQ